MIEKLKWKNCSSISMLHSFYFSQQFYEYMLNITETDVNIIPTATND